MTEGDGTQSGSQDDGSQGEVTCSECGAALLPGSQFCGDCGATTPTGEPAAPGQPPSPIPKRTMMGLSGEMPPVIPPESPLPARLADDAGRATSAGMSQPAKGTMGRTMLGIPLAGANAPGALRGTLSPAGKLPKQPVKTMFGLPQSGMPVPVRAPAAPSSVEEPSAQASDAAASHEHAHERQPVAAKATMIAAGSLALQPPPSKPSSSLASTAFGLPTPMELRADERGPVDSSEPPTRPLPKDESTMLRAFGGESRDPSVTPLPPRFDDETSKVASQRPGYAAPSSQTNGQPSQTTRPPPARSIAPMVLSILGVLGVAALGAYIWLGRASGPAVEVRIDSAGGSEQMVFEVAGAKPGSKLRFGGIEQAIAGGRATFPLGAGSLQVGQNAVLFDVLEPEGKAHPGRVVLSLDYRVTVDSAPLHMGKGAVDVVVAALPGSRVWIGGEELKLDAQGRAQRREEIEASALADGKAVEHVASYRVQPPSQEAQVGEIKTVIPIASLQIDRPGLQIVTAADAVEIAGTVDPDATVTLDGEPIAVQGGRFLQSFALPSVGKHAPTLVARANGKAPRSVVLSIERVDDLAAAARGFAADPSLTYTKIATNPAIYQGQKAAFEGRIYNVSVDGGKSVLQILARDCTAGRRCPLWVEYGAATDLTVDRWVRAVGTLAGARQFRAENDAVQTVPRLDAFVLVPIEP